MMKKLEKLKLKELAKSLPCMSEKEKIDCVGGDHVFINVNRTSSGPNSTLSSFTCNSYDYEYSLISTISGYFLEPRYDSALSTTSGSDTAICEGSYYIVPSTYHGENSYALSNVPGRTGIQIHPGNTGDDTTGCFLPGASYYELSSGDYGVSNSIITRDNLYAAFDSYGRDGIIMNITNGF
jgi:natural product precursor